MPRHVPIATHEARLKLGKWDNRNSLYRTVRSRLASMAATFERRINRSVLK
jgi:hypothetical protein